MAKQIVILGAGISGLATAYWLKKSGFNVTVLERNSQAGGSMISSKEKGYLIDFGPNSGLETSNLIKPLVEEVGLAKQMIYANPEGNRRYILRNGDLHPLPINPISLFKSHLFSAKAKLRLLAEPFIGKSADGYYQSIAQFVRRRLGNEFLDYAINPFVAGVFAGNPEELSVKSAFPKLYALEEKYGGLIKGMLRGAKERKQRGEQSKQSAKMFSFMEGMQQLPLAIARKLQSNITFSAEVKSIGKKNKKYVVTYYHEGQRKNMEADAVVTTFPAYSLADMLGQMDPLLGKHLKSIYYPPVMVLYLGYDKNAIKRKLDGFGFLIPEAENKSFLGAIWTSTIFKARASNGKVSFTLFIGGARNPGIFKLNKAEIRSRVLEEFHQIMGISSGPSFMVEKYWSKAIPQYHLGYIECEKYFGQFESQNPGLFLSGNYRGGISVGDCIKNSEAVFNRVKKYLTK